MNEKENKEGPFSKIIVQVAGTIMTALILYLIGININGERSTKSETQNVTQPQKEENIGQQKAKDKDLNSAQKRKGEKIPEANKVSDEAMQMQPFKNEGEGLSIKIIEASTLKAVAGVSISFSGFPDILISNQSGDFIIPKSIIEKRGEYNSVRAYFTRNGFEPVNFEIGLSEPQIFKINKSK